MRTLFDCCRMVASRLAPLVPAALLLVVWQLSVSASARSQAIFSSPLLVAAATARLWAGGGLLLHTAVTAGEALSGFVVGTVLGAAIGTSLWYWPALARIAKPYVCVLGSLPVLALAPALVVWLGVGFWAKAVLAAFTTVIVAIVQAYSGALATEQRFLRLLTAMGATRRQLFIKAVIPSALSGVVDSMRLNAGFAVLGAFMGECLSSRAGLGFLIVDAARRYDMATIYATCLLFAALSLVMAWLVGKLERLLLPWQYGAGRGLCPRDWM